MNHKGTKNTKKAANSSVQASAALQFVRLPQFAGLFAVMLVNKQLHLPQTPALSPSCPLCPLWFNLDDHNSGSLAA
jgi:hypothetical protein